MSVCCDCLSKDALRNCFKSVNKTIASTKNALRRYKAEDLQIVNKQSFRGPSTNTALSDKTRPLDVQHNWERLCFDLKYNKECLVERHAVDFTVYLR
jgi:hypothetical protein